MLGCWCYDTTNRKIPHLSSSDSLQSTYRHSDFQLRVCYRTLSTWVLWGLVLAINLTHLGKGTLSKLPLSAWPVGKLWAIFLTANWCMRAPPTVVVPPQGRRAWAVEKGSWVWAWEQPGSRFSKVCAPGSCLSFCPFDDQGEETHPFLPQVGLGPGVYYSSRKANQTGSHY